MALHRSSGGTSLDRLGPQDLIDAFAFLDREPILNVYLIALTLRDGLARPRDEYWGVRVDGEIVGLLHLGAQSGAVLPVGDSGPAIETLAEHARTRLGALPRRFQVIGPRPAVSVFADAFAASGLSPRIERPQIYMTLRRGSRAPTEPLPELRPARPGDFDAVYLSGAELRAEELDEDPRKVDAAAYARRVEDECRDGYTWVWCDERGLVFRASVSALTGDAAQVSGVYTAPAWRNRGVARRALGELCARLLEKSAAVCLFVNDFNAPAIALYRRLGFEAHADWASAFYGPPTR
jgi:ribosomal protein S18 acetylase RimI-like enzyme